jgi:hypothetical protein
MAQTIAIQRGTQSLASGTLTTLFTQSGGTATRVIFSQITFASANSVDMYYPSVILIHASSSGPTNVIGLMKANSGSIYSLNFMPNGNATAPNQFGYSGTGNAYNGAVMLQQGNPNVYMGGANPTNISYSAATSGSNYCSYMPSNYWIGPSDSIKIKWYDGNGNSCDVGWSMTTITES